jgi:hypothetical protein
MKRRLPGLAPFEAPAMSALRLILERKLGRW